MSTNPALIVRHDPSRTETAIAETRSIMEAIGEPGAMVKATGIDGNLKVIPEGDAHEAQEAVTRLAADRPELFRFTSRWTVVDQWVQTDIDEIRRAVAAYQNDLRGIESWRLAVRPAASTLHRDVIVDAVAPLLDAAHVDLEDPAKEIRIDILGGETGIGLVDRNEVFHHASGPHDRD